MAKYLHPFLSLVLWVVGIVAVLWLVLSGVARLNGGSLTVEGTIDRTSVVPQASAPLVTGPDGSVFSIGPTFAGTKGTVTVQHIDVIASFGSPGYVQTALVSASGLLWLLVTFGVVWQLRALTRVAASGEPFADGAPRRVRMIGYLVLATALVKLIEPWVRQAVINSHDIGVAVSSVGVAWGSVISRVGVGLVVLVLADVFAQGVHLRELEESVV